MNEISEFAQEVALDIKDENKSYSFDIGLILIIGSIVVNIIKLLIRCNLFGRKLEDRVKNPGPIEKILLRRAVKQELPQEYAHLKEQIQEQILNQVKNLSSEKINLMAQEVKNAG